MVITTLACLCIALCHMLVVSGQMYNGYHSTKHECLRTCEWPPQPRTCVYNFTVDWFYSMSVACNDCPINKTHCDNQYCILLNGVARPIAIVNKMLPGPSIQVCEDDTIVVKVTNNLDDSEGLGIHWHGVHQRGTPYMDGVPMVTQCPIASQSSFTYTFKAKPYGTHWWHSHSGFQRADGVFGAMIFRQAPQADVNSALYDFDLPEHVIAVHDWFDVVTHTKYIAHIYGGGDHVPDSILINGKGHRRGFSNDKNETVYTERETFNVTPERRYRFRVFSNAITVCPIKVSVDNHKLTIIASDGASLQPYEADAFVINSGERYDFVLNTNQEPRKYLMRVQGLVDCSGLEELAFIQYDHAPNDDPDPEEKPEPEIQNRKEIVLNPWGEVTSEKGVPIVDVDCADAIHESLPAKADVVYYLDMGFNKVNKYFQYPSSEGHGERGGNEQMVGAGHDAMVDTGHVHMGGNDDSGGYGSGHSAHAMHYLYTAQINHMSFKMSSRPLLTQHCEIPKEEFCLIASNTSKTYPGRCEDEFCSCTQMINVTLGQVVDLVLVDEGHNFEMAHPMHLHGYSFQVIAQGTLGASNTVEEVMRQDQAGKITRKLENAPCKDTIIVQNGGYTIVRFVADNPGWWFFHCHAQFHVQAGMSLVVLVGSDKDLPPKPTNFPYCGSWPSDEKDFCNFAQSDLKDLTGEAQD